jgi:hypothetical protein
MPSISIADAVVLFQPDDGQGGSIKPGTLRIAHLENYALRRKFAMDWPAAFLSRSRDPHVRLAGLMLLFRYLTVEVGLPAKVVDAAFMEIEEYANALCGD